MDDTKNDPWAAPPDWAPLPDVPGWIERRLGFPGLPLVPELISAVRAGKLKYRIGGVQSRSSYSGNSLPPGLTTSGDRSRRIIVSDWEKAEPDWRAGTVAGWKQVDGSRSRHPIEVQWMDLERWVPPVAHDHAYRVRKAAALAEKVLTRHEARSAATAAGEVGLQKWLEAEMRASLEVSPGKDEMMRRAEERGHIFSEEGFIRCWGLAIKATGASAWSKPGRKSTGANRKAK